MEECGADIREGFIEKVLSSACSGQRVKTQKRQLRQRVKKCKGNSQENRLDSDLQMAQCSWNLEYRRLGDHQSQISSGDPVPRAVHVIHRRLCSESARAVSGRGRTKGENRILVSQ